MFAWIIVAALSGMLFGASVLIVLAVLFADALARLAQALRGPAEIEPDLEFIDGELVGEFEEARV